MLFLIASLLTALPLAVAESAEPPARPAAALDVPFLPQTEDLCGGAAVAMLFRYWGDLHASVEQFAPLVDRRRGGITTKALTEAVRTRGWRAHAVSATSSALRAHLRQRQPVVLLLEDRPGRFHYVVAVGADQDGFVVHDPVWGPFRRISEPKLLKAWKPAMFWGLVVQPGEGSNGASRDSTSAEHESALVRAEESSDMPRTRCERLLDTALAEIAQDGLASADRLLPAVQKECPDAAAPWSELAAVRFAQRRWADARSLADEALRNDDGDAYAWDVLGSSRFMMDDLPGALDAWNHVGKPSLDSVRIDGLTRTRYSLVAESLGLEPGRLLTGSRYRIAERRLHALPARASSRMSYRPGADGFATVDVAIVERPVHPSLVNMAAHAGLNREVSVGLPGWSGQGDLWSASWRWWARRPALNLSYAAPRIGFLPGVWRVVGEWSREAYRDAERSALISERRTHVGVSVSNWISPDVRYEIATGMDSWNAGRRQVFFGGGLEHRALDDRLTLTGSLRAWSASRSGRPFGEAGFGVSTRSSARPQRWLLLGQAHMHAVTAEAPFALWPGAGDGHGRPLLLRAHPLLHDGIIEGPVFGRRVAALTVEAQRWFALRSLVRPAVAAFADAAFASRRMPSAEGRPLHFDVGVGLRLRVPGRDGMLRVDFGHGLRDGRHALSFGWQPGT